MATRKPVGPSREERLYKCLLSAIAAESDAAELLTVLSSLEQDAFEATIMAAKKGVLLLRAEKQKREEKSKEIAERRQSLEDAVDSMVFCISSIAVAVWTGGSKVYSEIRKADAEYTAAIKQSQKSANEFRDKFSLFRILKKKGKGEQ